MALLPICFQNQEVLSTLPTHAHILQSFWIQSLNAWPRWSCTKVTEEAQEELPKVGRKQQLPRPRLLVVKMDIFQPLYISGTSMLAIRSGRWDAAWSEAGTWILFSFFNNKLIARSEEENRLTGCLNKHLLRQAIEIQVCRVRWQPVKAQEVPDHVRPSFNTAFSLQVYFMQSKFWAYQASLFPSYASPPFTAHLCPSSHSLCPSSASRKPQYIHVSYRMPFLHSKPTESSLGSNKLNTLQQHYWEESSGPATSCICCPLVGKLPLSLNF